ncbi:MAG: 23S rRNA (pseudouridine(1915)-N(3))-methyltransferase RlmH [Oscillospiraceae bacterium]
MPLRILSVGKLGEPWMRQGCEEYLKRLGGTVTVTEIPEQRLPQNPSPAQIQQALSREAKLMRDKIPPRAYTVALCIEGELMTSPKLAGILEQSALHHPSGVLLIGSSYGLDAALKQEAKLRLSLSPMTFPHQLARILLLEQLYRASSIQVGGKYHK